MDRAHFAGVPNRELPTTNKDRESTLTDSSPSCQRRPPLQLNTSTSLLANVDEQLRSHSLTPIQPPIIAIWSRLVNRRPRWGILNLHHPPFTFQSGARELVQTAGKERIDVKAR